MHIIELYVVNSSTEIFKKILFNFIMLKQHIEEFQGPTNFLYVLFSERVLYKQQLEESSFILSLLLDPQILSLT